MPPDAGARHVGGGQRRRLRHRGRHGRGQRRRRPRPHRPRRGGRPRSRRHLLVPVRGGGLGEPRGPVAHPRGGVARRPPVRLRVLPELRQRLLPGAGRAGHRGAATSGSTWATTSTRTPAAAPPAPTAPTSASRWRSTAHRYALYKTDPDLQAAHHAAPVVAVWDDHEVDNNYEVVDDARRTAGYRAWFEHLPVRLPAPDGPSLQIYRGFRWGDLASFHMLDVRQYRDPAPCGGGLDDCPERLGEDRTILGADQQAWLQASLGSSAAVWDVVGQQVVFSPLPFGGAVQQRPVGRLPAAAGSGVGDAARAPQPGDRHRRHPRRGRGGPARDPRRRQHPTDRHRAGRHLRSRHGSIRRSSTPPRRSSTPCPTSSTATPPTAATPWSTSPATGWWPPSRS